MRPIGDANLMRPDGQRQAHRGFQRLQLSIDQNRQPRGLRNEAERSGRPLQIDDQAGVARDFDNPVLVAESFVAHHEGMPAFLQRDGARRHTFLVAIEDRFGIGGRGGEMEKGFGGRRRRFRGPRLGRKSEVVRWKRVSAGAGAASAGRGLGGSSFLGAGVLSAGCGSGVGAAAGGGAGAGLGAACGAAAGCWAATCGGTAVNFSKAKYDPAPTAASATITSITFRAVWDGSGSICRERGTTGSMGIAAGAAAATGGAGAAGSAAGAGTEAESSTVSANVSEELARVGISRLAPRGTGIQP